MTVSSRRPAWGWRVAALVAATALIGWGAWTRFQVSGPDAAEKAIRQADPTLTNVAIRLVEGPYYVDRGGFHRPRLKLWCGRVEGRGEVGVLVRHSRRRTLATIEQVALDWRPGLDEQQRWLLNRCEAAAA